MSAMASSAKRTIPLRIRPDLVREWVSYQQNGSWVIKDPVTLKYFRLQPEQYRILELLDGKRSLEQIRDEYRKSFPTNLLSLEEIQSLTTDFHRSGLVISERFNQGVALVERKREERKKQIISTLKNILYLRLPGWDPEPTLRFLDPLFKWMFTPLGVAFWAIMVVSSWTLLAVQFEEFRQKLPAFHQFFGWPNLMYLWIVLGGAKIIHEFGHGLSCKRFGGECHEMGAMLLVFSPCLYCDVTDSWLMHNKWHRIMIGAAGMYIEVLLSAFAIFGWWFSEPGLFNYLCLNLFFVSTVTTVIFNINPLMRYDGYYMLADFLEIPNLRPKADKLLRDNFAWWCLGIDSRPDPFMPQRGHFWFVLFAIASNIYKWVVMFAILFFFYTFLKPYELQSIGVAIAVGSLVSIIISIGMTVYKIVTAPRRDKLSKVKVTITLLVLTSAVACALLVPFPWSIESALVIEPHEVQHVYTFTPGRLEEVKVKPGDRVKTGDILAVQSNLEKEEEIRKVEMDLGVQVVEIRLQRALQDPRLKREDAFARQRLAEEKRDSLTKQLKDLREQIEKLTVRAPCDGVVVAPPRVEESKLNQTRVKLATWHGTPFDPRNRFAFLQARTHLLSIAPDDQFQAILLVDQGDRNDIQAGTEIRLKLDHVPEVTYLGKVAEISERPVEFAPRALSNKSGGDLPTTTDSQGREKLESVAYQATVILDQDTDLLTSGLRGRAKFIVAERSVTDWTWRYLRRTFHFRL